MSTEAYQAIAFLLSSPLTSMSMSMLWLTSCGSRSFLKTAANCEPSEVSRYEGDDFCLFLDSD